MDHATPTRYSAVAQAFHWLTAILVLVTFLYGPGGSEQRVYMLTHDFDRRLHETLGLCVFVLVILRVLWRLVDTRPEPVPASFWMRLAAKSIQGALYLLMFALPITAILGAWLEGHPLTLLLGLDIPSVVAVSRTAGTTLAMVHPWLGDAILWLAGFHALAALYHHFLLKDGVLAAMLPRWAIK